jgi:amino acid transporter
VVVALLSTGIGLIAINSADLVTSMVTFGSLAAYCLLHVAVMRYFAGQGKRRRSFAHMISPILGLAILLYTLWKTPALARIVGTIWLAVGVLIYQFQRRSRSGAN